MPIPTPFIHQDPKSQSPRTCTFQGSNEPKGDSYRLMSSPRTPQAYAAFSSKTACKVFGESPPWGFSEQVRGTWMHGPSTSTIIMLLARHLGLHWKFSTCQYTSVSLSCRVMSRASGYMPCACNPHCSTHSTPETAVVASTQTS